MCKTRETMNIHTHYMRETREIIIFIQGYIPPPNSSPLIDHILERYMICFVKKKKFTLRRKLLNVDWKENKFLKIVKRKKHG